MFKDIINRTPFTTDEADKYFTKINGSAYNSDWSFLTTLRALVGPRMKEDDSPIRLYFTRSGYTSGAFATNSDMTMVNAIMDNGPLDLDRSGYPYGVIEVHNLNADAEGNKAAFRVLENSFEAVYGSGWHRLQKFTDFFKKSFDSMCFIDQEHRDVVIFVANLTIPKMHYMQCGIFAFLPWYFDPKVGVSELEMDLINSLRGKDASEYKRCIGEIAKAYDFRSMKIKSLLEGFEKRADEKSAASIRSDISDIIYRINELSEKIGNCLKDKSDKETTLLGLETKLAETNDEDSEIMNYFLRNTHLVLDEVSDDYIIFECKDYIMYFDEDLARTCIDNPRSYIYAFNHDVGISNNNMRKLMNAVFIDQSLKIKFCAAYKLNLVRSVSGLSNYSFSEECEDCMPNPHIDQYRCLGNYEKTLSELMMRHDYIGAIEQCLASCRSLNFGDSTVMREFMRQICSPTKNNKCIELPDGSVVKPKEAIEWLNKQEEAE